MLALCPSCEAELELGDARPGDLVVCAGCGAELEIKRGPGRLEPLPEEPG